MGAGFTFMLVATIAHESGQGGRTVYRALDALEGQGHLERSFFRRTPELYRREGLLPAARRGQGPNVYRVSAALRARAGLHEVEWTPDTPKRAAGDTARVVAHPTRETEEPRRRLHPGSGRGRPDSEPVESAQLQGDHV